MKPILLHLRTLLSVALLLAACSSAGPAAPAATPSPAAISAASTATAAATPSPTASDTPALVVSPTAATSSTAAVNETPTLAAISTAADTATPAPAASVTPDLAASADRVDPLTGLLVDSPAVLDRRPLALKIAEFPRRVRPQFGLSLADNVWEHYAEGGVTRFTAIFLSQGADKLGNIRSARLIDTYLGQAYQAMLVGQGTSAGVLDRLRHTDFYNRFIAEESGYRGCPIMCREESGAVSSDKLFTSAPALWDLEVKLGLSGRQDLSGFTFDPQPPAGGQPASTVHLDFQLDNNVVEWRYDATAQDYARWVDGANLPQLDPHLDASTGRQITAANVVVLSVPYSVTNFIENEAGQLLSYDVLLIGHGAARLFRDGQLYDAQWTRASAGLPRLTDAAGQPLPFRPGQIWFEVVNTNSPSRFQGGVFSLRFSAPDAHATPAAPTLTATPMP